MYIITARLCSSALHSNPEVKHKLHPQRGRQGYPESSGAFSKHTFSLSLRAALHPRSERTRDAEGTHSSRTHELYCAKKNIPVQPLPGPRRPGPGAGARPPRPFLRPAPRSEAGPAALSSALTPRPASGPGSGGRGAPLAAGLRPAAGRRPLRSGPRRAPAALGSSLHGAAAAGRPAAPPGVLAGAGAALLGGHLRPGAGAAGLAPPAAGRR